MGKDFESNNLHRVLSVKIFGVDIGWKSAHDCLIDSRSLKNSVINKASHLDEYLKSSGLLNDYKVKIRITEADTWLEVFTFYANEELFEFREKEEAIREELRRRFVWSRDSLASGKSNHEIINNQPTNTLPVSYAEIQAFKKLLTGPTDSKMEIEFFGAGKEIVDFQKLPSVESNIVDEHETEEISGDVRFFDDALQKVTIFNLQDNLGFVAGQIALEVNKMTDRTALLTAQLEYNRLRVNFSPAKNPLRPDKQSREGRLIEIVSVGESNSKLW